MDTEVLIRLLRILEDTRKAEIISFDGIKFFLCLESNCYSLRISKTWKYKHLLNRRNEDVEMAKVSESSDSNPSS